MVRLKRIDQIIRENPNARCSLNSDGSTYCVTFIGEEDKIIPNELLKFFGCEYHKLPFPVDGDWIEEDSFNED